MSEQQNHNQATFALTVASSQHTTGWRRQTFVHLLKIKKDDKAMGLQLDKHHDAHPAKGCLIHYT